MSGVVLVPRRLIANADVASGGPSTVDPVSGSAHNGIDHGRRFQRFATPSPATAADVRPPCEPSPQVLGQFAAGRVPFVRFLGQVPCRQIVSSSAGIRRMLVSQWWWWRVQRMEDDNFQRAGERDLPAQKLVERHAQAVLVAGGLGLIAFAASLLGGQVGGRAEDRTDLRQLDAAGSEASQTEVGQVGPIFAVKQDIGRLDIAMDDSLLMGSVRARRQGHR